MVHTPLPPANGSLVSDAQAESGVPPGGGGGYLGARMKKSFFRLMMTDLGDRVAAGECIPKCNPSLQLQRVPTCYHDSGAI